MLDRFSIKLRFTLILASLIIGFSLFGMMAFYVMRTLNINGTVYQRIIKGKDIVADVLPPPEYIIESYLVSLQLSNSADTNEIKNLKLRLQKLKDEYMARHQYWLDQSLDKAIAEPLLDKSFVSAQEFYETAFKQFIPAVQAGDNLNARLILQKMQLSYDQHRTAINEVVQATNALNSTEESLAFKTIQWNSIGLLSIFLLSISSAIVLTMMISRGVIRQLGGEPSYASEIALQISNGKLDNDIKLKPGDKMSILASMLNMQEQLLLRINREALEKANALRIQKALDRASSKVMMADANYDIIYINDALIDMFKVAQEDIRKELQNFNVDTLLGANIDVFHKHPAHQRKLLDAIQAPLHSSFIVGGRYLDFIANPVFDETGTRIGTVVEWQDRTLEVKIEDEIKAIVENVKVGVLENRLSIQDKSGFMQTLSISINELTDIIEKVFGDIAHVMQSMAAGDLTDSISNHYEGIYGACKNDINATLTKISEVFTQIKDSADFIHNSSQEISTGNNNLSQRAEEQASSLEETASSMEELTSTVKNNAENAKQANTEANNAKKLAQTGGDIVNSAIKAMQDINDSSNQIAAIISVIDEIAFQTNLLALNASVEAARAGEHGRGFSVVATEVRGLAQRCASAARQSKTLIQNSVEKVKIGTDFVNQTGEALNDIVSGVNHMGTIISEIASASSQQSAGIEQINIAVAQMDEITQQNAALAEQASSSSVSMSEQTRHMTNLLEFFQISESTNS